MLLKNVLVLHKLTLTNLWCVNFWLAGTSSFHHLNIDKLINYYVSQYFRYRPSFWSLEKKLAPSHRSLTNTWIIWNPYYKHTISGNLVIQRFFDPELFSGSFESLSFYWHLGNRGFQIFLYELKGCVLLVISKTRPVFYGCNILCSIEGKISGELSDSADTQLFD